MILIENYLVQMARYLPEKGRADIVSELRSSLEEQVCDLADAHHRKPSSEDQHEVLRQLGHPMEYASSFKSHQYLIGPGIFPTYGHVLKIALVAVLCIQLAIHLLMTLIQDDQLMILQTFIRLWNTAFSVITVVTLIFIVIEYSGNKLNWFSKWDPTDLGTQSIRAVNNSDMFTNLVTDAIGLFVWNGLFNTGYSFEFDSQYLVEFSVIFTQVFWPVNIILGISVVLSAYVIIKGYWIRNLLLSEMAVNVSLIATVVYVLANPPFITFTLINDTAGSVWAGYTLIIAGLVIIAVCLSDMWKYYRMLTDMDSLQPQDTSQDNNSLHANP